jgi:hypothetical protein
MITAIPAMAAIPAAGRSEADLVSKIRIIMAAIPAIPAIFRLER